ncbi:hypothetical protein [Neptunitalea lumnitzerae]|nr:hypothetical protein [Neptunitalea sp. Y10]
MDFFQLSSRIERSASPDFGDIFSRTFDLYKKVWWQGFLMIACVFIIMIPFMVVVMLPMAGLSAFAEASEVGDAIEPIAIFSTLSWAFLAGLAMVIFMSFITYALIAGFLRVCKNADYYGNADTSDLFYYCKARYFGKTFVLGLAAAGISLIALMMCILPAYYVAVPINLFLVIFAFNPELSVSEIIKISFKLGNKYWILIFGLTLVLGMIASLGALACGIGIFFTACLQVIPLYYIYKDAVGFDEEKLVVEKF